MSKRPRTLWLRLLGLCGKQGVYLLLAIYDLLDSHVSKRSYVFIAFSTNFCVGNDYLSASDQKEAGVPKLFDRSVLSTYIPVLVTTSLSPS